MLLKDRHKSEGGSFGAFQYRPGHGGQGKGKRDSPEPCCQFNKGHCTYGLSCKYDHHCAVPECGKFGHGAHICRIRLAKEKDKGETIAVKESGDKN